MTLYEQLAPYYDRLHERLPHDIPFWLGLAEAWGGPVLELGCGSGRVLFPLALAGHTVTGLDNAPAMLSLAQSRLEKIDKEAQSRIDLAPGDMTDFRLGRQFRLIAVTHNTWTHLDARQRARALLATARHLAPEGRLVLDLPNAVALLDPAGAPASGFVAQGRFVDEATGREVVALASSELQPERSLLRVSWAFETRAADDTPTTRQVLVVEHHLIYPHELELELRQSGLRLSALFGSYDRSAFQGDSERLIAVAEAAT